MIARLAVLLMALMSTGSAHAALWYLQGSDTVFGSFEYTESAGYGVLDLYFDPNPDPDSYIFSLSTFVAGDATYLQALNYNSDGNYSSVLTLLFEAPLTDLGGAVAVAPQSNINVFFNDDCDLVCFGTGVSSVTTTAPVPLPNTALLVLAAVGGLVVLRYRQQLRNREQHAVIFRLALRRFAPDFGKLRESHKRASGYGFRCTPDGWEGCSHGGLRWLRLGR